ncbi:MAG: SDR family NAD(P)-dependent oxidoreductase [Bradyrhizobiaceae bacterium]|nr:SDR family NAD(P)-dependent oxidoreductase [Hyphomicrobiales bacterium]MBV9428737.1 SDR family NAD(P)-dependent oxidoreductase [Bradyrhizobiaceae bacterium]
MQGKVVVMSGATSGIGEIAAVRLAAEGARLVLIGRDRARGEATLARLRAAAPDPGHVCYYADLSSLGETRRVAAAIAAAEPRVDVLANNAGAIFASRRVTADGLERTFALNHMSYFVLTTGLIDRLVAAAPARIVNTASNAHRNGHIDFGDLQSERRYRALAVYGTSKLCNILFTRELARRLAGRGVTTNSFTPGFVATRFGDQAGGLYAAGVRFAKLFAATAEKGAETLVYLAASSEAANINGQFLQNCRPGSLSAEAQDDAVAQQLWRESERIAGTS